MRKIEEILKMGCVGREKAAKQLGSYAAKNLEDKKVGRLEGRLVNSTFVKTSHAQQTDNSLPSYPPTFQPSKIAFTLAEVLITLGIVGVVSAMTMPNFIKNYQMKTLEVAFKKQYSNIYNTLNYISMEENLYECHYKYTSSWIYIANDCNILRNSMISRMQLKEIKHDFKNYALKSDVINNGGASTNIGFSYDEFVRDSRGKAYLSPDGSVYIFSDSFNRFKMFFVLDTNGKKGPNKWGYDVFFIGLYNKNNNLIPYFSFSLKEKGGFYPNEILQNKK